MDVSFTQIGSFSGVDGEAGVLSAPTSLQFGPDGRLYVSEQNGTINAFTIELIDGEYVATAHEEIQLPNGFGVITHIENHNDNGFTNSEDGSNAWQFSNRQVTGLVVAGTADAPVLYITSSDPRISSGSNESNLDTNSGVLTRVTLDPVTGEWDAVDLIRGLPRSEENHSNNGLQLSADGNSLYVMVGGHTNNGAPSNFFGNTTEYTLSGAMLEVDLVALDAMPILIDPNGGQPLPGNNGPNGIQSARQYVYDLPTLDDPNRENAPEFITQEHINELGLDQSQLGDTLTNDLALALGFQENFQGLDTNGPWGGNDGLNQAVLPADAPIRIFADGFRNPYDVVLTENGRFYSFDNGSNGNLGGDPLFVDGEATNAIVNGGSGDGDSLSLIVEGGYYGHANPTRSNQDGSLTTVDENGSRLIDSVSDLSDGVSDALAIADGYLIDPSRFAALDGLTPAEIDARLIQSGTRVTSNDANSTAIHTIGSSTNGITEYTGSAFDSALAGGLVTVSQNGTVTFVNLNADGTALAPLFGPGDDGILGTADDVEISSSGVFTIASGQAFPLDVTMGPDGTIFVANVGGGITVFAPSDLVLPDDPDFDNDDIDNIDDAFSRDATNGASVFAQPGGTLVFDFDANADGNLPGPNGIAAGLTGMAVNGVTDYEDFLLTESTRPGQDIQADNVKFQTAAGGGTNVIEFVSNGNASGTANDGEFLFQTGVTIAPTVETFVASWSVFNPGLGGFAGPGDINGGGFTEGADQEIGGFLGTGDQSNFLKLVATEDSVEGPGFLFELENGDVVLASQFIAAADLFAGQPVGQNQIELSIEVDIEAETATPTITYETAAGESVTLTGTAMSLAGSNVMTAIEGDHMIQGESSGLALGLWSTNGTAPEADAFQAIFDEISLTSNGDASRVVLHRVNTGGEEVAAIDGGPNWTADTNANPSVFRVTDNGASNSTDGFGVTPGASVPATTPAEIFDIGRFDQDGGGTLQYIFPDLEDGTYEVTLFLGNGYGPASAVGARIFDVSLEGSVPTEFDDIDPVALFGNDTGGALTTYVEVIDGALNIEFLHGVENPNPFGIEIARIGGEEAITVDVVSGTQIVAEDAAGPALISLLTSETVPVGEAVTVTFELASGSATAGEDFSIDLPGVTLTNGVYTGTLTIAGGSSDVQLSVDILDDLVSEMDEAFTFTITGTSGNAEIGNASATVTIEDNDGPAGDIVLAINAGGPALTQDGIDFIAGSAANFFTGGTNFSDGGAGNGEQAAFDGTVFETEVFGGAGASVLSFETDLAPGEYTVELYFAEIFLPNPGNGADTRIFDVSVEGELVIDDLNILEANGGDINGTIVQLLPQIFTPGLDGVLTIDLDGIVDNAKISGIVIREVDGNDSAAPVATIEVALPEVDTDDLVATVTFDEPVIGLESSDVTLTSPTLGDRADGVVDMAADGLSATVTFTAPIEGFANGDYSVALSAGGVVDLAGNDVAATNSGAATLTLALDINEVYDENVNGDLSDDGLNPTDLAPLMVGSNIVTLASTDANGDDASTGSDRDYFTIEVPEGHELSQVVLNNYAAGGFAGNLAYLALSDEDTINVDPAATEEPTDSNLIGGTLVGDSQEGADILQLLGGGFSGSGFSGPLPAGTYTFWLNQNVSTSTLSLDFVIEEVQVELVRGDLLTAINAGGPSLTQDGILFEANTAVEAPFEGSVIFSDGGGGNGNQPGLDGTVFETERNGNSDGDFTFALPVTSQQVFVDLYLAELFQSAEGVRIMDVYVEGELVLDDFDIYAALMEGVDQSDPAAVTAALNEGLVISLPNPVDVGANGTLDISFDGISDRGTVSGITVFEAIEEVQDSPPTFDAGAPTSINTDENEAGILADFDATDPDGDAITYSVTGTDAAAFTIDETTGELQFVAAPDFEAPTDADEDNVYDIDIVATAGGQSDLINVSVDVADVDETVDLVRGDLLTAINAGGPSLTQDGILFEANTAVEAPFEGSVIFSDGGGGNGNQPGLDGTVFETERNGNSDGDFTFALPVTSQQVFVDLYLAELFQSAEGVRIMDVYVEGELVLDDFDIYAALMEGVDQSDPAAVTAALNEGLVISLPNPVDVGANGTLDISFDGISDRGTVSGITVFEAVEDPGDVTAPIATLDITPAADALSPVVVAVTFDEPVTDLDASEVTLSGPDGDRADGVLDMAADGLSATVTFAAPAEGFTDGEYSAAIVAGAVQDAAANGNAAATTDAPVTFDFTPPTVTMTFEQTTTDEPLVVELTFSEPIEGLDVTDLLLANQNYSAQPDSVVLAADGLSGTATFVPPAGGFPEGVQAEAYDLTFVQDGVVDLAGLGNAAAGSIVELFDPADQEGRTELAVNIGSADLFGDSTFGANSIQISNVGQLEVVSITIDLGSTLIPQIVFDPSTDPVTGEPLPPAGDTANKDFDFGGASIGLIEGDVTVNYGDGQSPGFNQMLLTFEAGSFTTGDLLSFSIDIDPDSAYSPLGGGAVSGQELAGATFTVTYSDGSTATGTVAPEADATSGAVAVADTTQTLEAPTVTFADGSADPFITPDPDLPIVIDAGIENAGATVRVFVLESAFYDPDGNDLPVDFVGNNLNANAIAIDLVLDANGQFSGTIPVTRTDNLGTDQDGTNIGINTLAVAVLDANGDEGPFSTPLTVEHDPAHVVNGGRAEFGINIGSSDLFGDSTFFPNSMQITNTSASDNDIVSVTIDLANTLIPDIVFDPKFDPETGELLPPAGDSVNKDFEFGLNSLGLTEDDVTVSYGDGQSPGFNQIVLEFARGSFEVGDLLSFGIDIDPGSAYSPLGGGAVSGQELAGATFTVTYADGTTATGTVAPEADGTSGATAVAQAGQNLTAPTLTLADGTTDAITSADPDLPVIIDAGIENAGATARVFIQDTAYYTPDGSDAPEPYVGNNLNANTTAIDIVLDEDGQFTGTLPITRTDNLGTDQDGTNIGINAIAVALLDENGDEGPFSNTLTVEHDPVTVLNAGRAELAINIGNTDLYGASTFFADSMQITNTSTGDTDIVSVTIDLANTLIPNTVFDPKFDPETGELLPPAGDSVNKDFEFGLASLGLTEDDVTVTYGDGQNPGFNQITLEFAAGSFEVGDLLSFGIDIDPDSAYSPLGGGAVSGQELAGATFTVTYSDGTTATGTVAPEADGTNGAVAVAQAGQDLATPTLTFADGTTDPFTSTDPDLPVIIDAGIENAGATVRVFIQDTAYYTPDGSAAPEAYVGNNLNAFTTAIDIVLDANGQYTGTLPITRTDNQNTAEDGNNIGINAIAVAMLDENGDEGPFSDTLTVEFNEFFVPGFNSIVATEPFDILTGTDAADIFIFPAGTSDTAAIDVIKNIGPDDLIDLSRTGVEEGTLEVRTISGGSTIKLIQGFGADQFQLKVELNGLTAQQVLDAIIYANQINEAPNAFDDASSTEEETSVVVNVLDNDTDPNNDVLGVDEFTQGANGTVVDLGNGNLQYTPNAGFIGQDTFDYTVADTEGLTDTATVTINVTEEGANLAPVAVDDTATTEQDTAVQVFVLNNDSDPDLDAITLDSVSNVAGGQAVIVDDGINPAFVQFTPDAGFVGTASFDYVISDADGLTAAATATVTVNPVGGGVNIINATGPTETLFATSDPDIIVFEPGTSTTAALDIVQGYGADDQIDLSALGLEAGDLEVRLVGGGNILKLIEGFGSNDFQLKVELNGLSVQEVLDSIIYDAGVNTAPNAVADAATAIENQSVVVDVLDNDTDAQNDTLSVSAFTQGTNGAVIELPDGTLQYTPNPDFFGQDTFSYTVSDPDGLTDTEIVTITVNEQGVNTAPTAVADAASTIEEQSVIIDVIENDTDPENDALTIDVFSQGQNGVVSQDASGNLVYTPNANFVGTDTFTYTVSDTGGLTDQATVTVSVDEAGSLNVVNAGVGKETFVSTDDTDVYVFEAGTSVTGSIDVIEGYDPDDIIDVSALGIQPGDLEARVVSGGQTLKLIEGFGSGDFQLRIDLDDGLTVQQVLDSVVYADVPQAAESSVFGKSSPIMEDQPVEFQKDAVIPIMEDQPAEISKNVEVPIMEDQPIEFNSNLPAPFVLPIQEIGGSDGFGSWMSSLSDMDGPLANAITAPDSSVVPGVQINAPAKTAPVMEVQSADVTKAPATPIMEPQPTNEAAFASDAFDFTGLANVQLGGTDLFLAEQSFGASNAVIDRADAATGNLGGEFDAFNTNDDWMVELDQWIDYA